MGQSKEMVRRTKKSMREPKKMSKKLKKMMMKMMGKPTRMTMWKMRTFQRRTMKRYL